METKETYQDVWPWYHRCGYKEPLASSFSTLTQDLCKLAHDGLQSANLISVNETCCGTLVVVHLHFSYYTKTPFNASPRKCYKIPGEIPNMGDTN